MKDAGQTQAPGQPGGILVIDKPEGISSAGLVAAVKRSLKVKKAGHAGTLDPMATGVMVCCINQATKLARFFLGGEKGYEATLLLGAETDTQDAAGEITATRRVPALSADEIRGALEAFAGEISQVPPVYSALKHKGVPLYKLARQGRPVQKPPRRVRIRSIRLLEVALPEVRFEVVCSAGTYVRTLCADIGTRLGCGGHMKALRRTMACGFGIEQAIPLETFKAQALAGRGGDHVIPMARALDKFPEAVATPEIAARIRHGQPLQVGALALPHGGAKKYIKVVDTDYRLLAVLSVSGQKNSYDYECVLM